MAAITSNRILSCPPSFYEKKDKITDTCGNIAIELHVMTVVKNKNNISTSTGTSNFLLFTGQYQQVVSNPKERKWLTILVPKSLKHLEQQHRNNTRNEIFHLNFLCIVCCVLDCTIKRIRCVCGCVCCWDEKRRHCAVCFQLWTADITRGNRPQTCSVAPSIVTAI